MCSSTSTFSPIYDTTGGLSIMVLDVGMMCPGHKSKQKTQILKYLQGHEDFVVHDGIQICISVPNFVQLLNNPLSRTRPCKGPLRTFWQLEHFSTNWLIGLEYHSASTILECRIKMTPCDVKFSYNTVDCRPTLKRNLQQCLIYPL